MVASLDVPKSLRGGHKGAVACASFTRAGGGEYLLTGGIDRTVRLWNSRKGELIATFGGPMGYSVRAVEATADNAHFACAGEDRCAFVWDVTTKQVLCRFFGHRFMVNDLAFHETGTVLATASYAKPVKLWDCRSPSSKPMQVLSNCKDSITSVDIAGHEICAASVDGCVYTYDVRVGQMIIDDLCKGPITSIAIARDQKHMLVNAMGSARSSGHSGEMLLLDRSSGDVVHTFTGHIHVAEALRGCAFDSSGTVAFAPSEDGRVLLFDAATGAQLLTIPARGTSKLSCATLNSASNAPVVLVATFSGSVDLYTSLGMIKSSNYAIISLVFLHLMSIYFNTVHVNAAEHYLHHLMELFLPLRYNACRLSKLWQESATPIISTIPKHTPPSSSRYANIR